MDLTHLDDSGHPVMVDVSTKDITVRTAEAEGEVRLSLKVFESIRSGSIVKGDVFKIAETAGIMALKKTSDLIPLCHSIRIEHSSVRCELIESSMTVRISCTVKTREVTGVEMEAITGVMGAALTIYDMCKAIDKTMTISNIRLLSKTGGKSGSFLNKKESLDEDS